MKQTLVLSSTENFVWLSMQEIIPAIEKTWLESSRSNSHQVEILCVDSSPLHLVLRHAMASDTIVFTCFTVKLAKIGELLRTRFSLNVRYIVYLHNQATIACWPLFEWGIGHTFNEDDIFISSSTVDAKTFLLTFERAQVKVIPFPCLNPKPELNLRQVNSSDEIQLVYVGRISVQKNLHSLLYAIFLLKQRLPYLRFQLTIFGGEDHLGSPNMGMSSTGYLDYLKKLSIYFEIDHLVTWRGYLARECISSELEETPHIFVSASLHSDENFGMAALQSVSWGNPAVLTHWGGHIDFFQHHFTSVSTSPVYESFMGPWVDLLQFSLLLEKQMFSMHNSLSQSLHSKKPYLFETIAEDLLKLILKHPSHPIPLKPTQLANIILKKRSSYFHDSQRRSKIFESYADPNAHIFFRSYGMSLHNSHINIERSHCIQILPWTHLNEDHFEVQDPHRGNYCLPFKKGPIKVLNSVEELLVQVDEEAAVKLLRAGLAHCRHLS